MPVTRFIYDCYLCGARVSANEKRAGTSQHCPHCGKMIRIPGRNEMTKEFIKKYDKNQAMYAEEMILITKGRFILPSWAKPAMIGVAAVIALVIIISIFKSGDKAPVAPQPPAPATNAANGTPDPSATATPTEPQPNVAAVPGAGQPVVTNGGTSANPPSIADKVKHVSFMQTTAPASLADDAPIDYRTAPRTTAYSLDLQAMTINGQYLVGATADQVQRWLGKPTSYVERNSDALMKNAITGKNSLCFEYPDCGLKFWFDDSRVISVEIQMVSFVGDVKPFDPRRFPPFNFLEQVKDNVASIVYTSRGVEVELYMSNRRSVAFYWRGAQQPTFSSVFFGRIRNARSYYNGPLGEMSRTATATAASAADALKADTDAADIDIDFSTGKFRGVPFSQLTPDGFILKQFPEIEFFENDNCIPCDWYNGKKAVAFPIRSLGLTPFFIDRTLVGFAVGTREFQAISEMAATELGSYKGSVGASTATIVDLAIQPETRKVLASMSPSWRMIISGTRGELAVWPVPGAIHIANLTALNFIAVIPENESADFRKWLTSPVSKFSSFELTGVDGQRKSLTHDLLLDDSLFPIPAAPVSEPAPAPEAN